MGHAQAAELRSAIGLAGQYAAVDAAREAGKEIRQLESLAAAGCLTDDARYRLETIYKRYRSVAHRLTLDARPALVAPGDFEAERDYVLRQWRTAFGAAEE